MAKKIVRLVRYDNIYALWHKDTVINGDPIIVPFPATQPKQTSFVAIFEVREMEEECW